jgi:hypothetical protein
MNNKTLWIIALVLLFVGFYKPDFNLGNKNVVKPNDKLVLVEPEENYKDNVEKIIKALSVSSDRKVDGRRLAETYNDISSLIELDNDTMVVGKTSEIRQVNSMVGIMLKLDIKGKYPDLPSECKEVIKEAIGDNDVLLTPDLRAKTVEGFRALAWACNEGSK